MSPTQFICGIYLVSTTKRGGFLQHGQLKHFCDWDAKCYLKGETFFLNVCITGHSHCEGLLRYFLVYIWSET